MNSVRGGWYFSKVSDNPKFINYPRGEGVKPNLDFFPNIPVVLSDASS